MCHGATGVGCISMLTGNGGLTIGTQVSFGVGCKDFISRLKNNLSGIRKCHLAGFAFKVENGVYARHKMELCRSTALLSLTKREGKETLDNGRMFSAEEGYRRCQTSN